MQRSVLPVSYTHLDVYKRQIPNMTVMAPKNLWELRRELDYALNEHCLLYTS